MNPNMVPPAPPPPPPPPHFPPGNPDAPRIIQHQAPAVLDPTRLAGQMGRLNINTNRSHPGSSQIPKGPRQYEGYTFFKADTFPGEKATWSRAERTKMHLGQEELAKMVQKRSKKTSASQQYHSLSKTKRTHVDQLVEELRRIDPRAEWHCVYVNVDEKPCKGKGSRPGDYETVSMDVVVKRKASSATLPQTPFGDFVDLGSPIGNRKFDSPFPGEDFTPINRGMEGNAPFPRPNGPPSQFHPPVNGFRQSPPRHFHEHLPPLPQGPAMGGPPMFQGPKPRPQMPPGAIHPPPGMHGPPPVETNNEPPFEVLNGPGAGPTSPNAHHPRPRSDKLHPPFSSSPNNQFQRPHYLNTKASHKHIAKSPNMHHHEPKWGHESSSVEDDESMMFDLEDDTSGTEDTDTEVHDTFQPARGTLLRHHSHMKHNRHEPVYRSHSRHQPSRYTLDKKHSQKRYRSGSVDLLPVGRTSSKRLGRAHSKEIVTYGSRGRPMIFHAADTPFDDEYIHNARSGRAHNDIRTRMLDDREARLERRENMLDLQGKMLDGSLNDRYLSRQLPPVEPCYHGRYLH